MEKTFKTSEIVTTYNALKSSKVTKLADADKIAVVKIMRTLKPVTTSFTDFVEDAREKLQPENFKETQEKAQRFNELTDTERLAVNLTINKYNTDLNKAANDELAKEVTVDFTPLGAEAFDKLIASNDLDIETIMTIQDVIAEV